MEKNCCFNCKYLVYDSCMMNGYCNNPDFVESSRLVVNDYRYKEDCPIFKPKDRVVFIKINEINSFNDFIEDIDSNTLGIIMKYLVHYLVTGKECSKTDQKVAYLYDVIKNCYINISKEEGR